MPWWATQFSCSPSRMKQRPRKLCVSPAGGASTASCASGCSSDWPIAIASSVRPAFRSSSARSGRRDVFWLGVFSTPAFRAAARLVFRKMFFVGSRPRVIAASRCAIRALPLPLGTGSRVPRHPASRTIRPASRSAGTAGLRPAGPAAGCGPRPDVPPGQPKIIGGAFYQVTARSPPAGRGSPPGRAPPSSASPSRSGCGRSGGRRRGSPPGVPDPSCGSRRA